MVVSNPGKPHNVSPAVVTRLKVAASTHSKNESAMVVLSLGETARRVCSFSSQTNSYRKHLLKDQSAMAVLSREKLNTIISSHQVKSYSQHSLKRNNFMVLLILGTLSLLLQ